MNELKKSSYNSGLDEGLFKRKGKVPLMSAVPIALAHVLAAFAAIVAPAIIISSICGFSPEEQARIIQVALFLSALDTLLQQFPLFGKIGSGLPIIMGASFTFIPAFRVVGIELGFEAVLGAQLVGSLVAIVFGLFYKRLRFLFPPTVMGTVIFVIGLSLCPVAVKSMAGGEGAATFGALNNWIIALITFAIVFAFGNFGKRLLKLGSILIGIVVGFIVSIPFGLVNLSGVANAGLFSLPQLLPYHITFVPAACVVIGIVAIVNSVQIMGELSVSASGGMDRDATSVELAGGMVAQGAVGVIATFLGGIATVTFGQNAGLVAENKVVNRTVFTIAALVLLVAGLVPVLSQILTSIPQPVVGGATLGVFATIGMNGAVMFARAGFSPRNRTIIGIAIAFGVGIEQSVGALAGAGMPDWVNTVFGTSSIAVATVVAVLLNLILPKDKPALVFDDSSHKESGEVEAEPVSTLPLDEEAARI